MSVVMFRVRGGAQARGPRAALSCRGWLAAELVEQAGVGSGDLVVEIGAGTGVLTEALARRAGRVVAVEYDPRLAERARTRLERADLVIQEQAARRYAARRPATPESIRWGAWSRRSATGSCVAWPTTSGSRWTPGRPTSTPCSGPACSHFSTAVHLGRVVESP